MTVVHAYAANEAKGKLEPFEYELGQLSGDEVDIAVETCGICHSDLSMLNDEWGLTTFPFVPGHEVIGTISAKGENVTHLAVGDRVGLGWHSGYCMMCDECVDGHHNLCPTAEPTIVGRHGGFADLVRAKAISAIKLSDSIDARSAGPLLCGGMAVFNPLVQSNMSPVGHVGVIGIGGLGHLAIKFAKAWGCHVTAFTSSKPNEAIALGADIAINSRNTDEITSRTRTLDLLLSTVNVNLDWDSFMATLKPRGRLHLLGVLTDPFAVNMVPMLFNELSVSSSPVGSPGTIRKMLEFSARHQIQPVTEYFKMSNVNDAMARLAAGKANYRIVLEN